MLPPNPPPVMRATACTSAAAMAARTALEIATRGGAAVLGRDDIGHLAPGMSADFVAIDIDQPHFAGAHDLVAALVLCQPTRVDYAFVNGRCIVERRALPGIDAGRIVTEACELARALHLGVGGRGLAQTHVF